MAWHSSGSTNEELVDNLVGACRLLSLNSCSRKTTEFVLWNLNFVDIGPAMRSFLSHATVARFSN